MRTKSRWVHHFGQFLGLLTLFSAVSGWADEILPDGRLVGVVPQPPRQDEPWTPPKTTIPKFLVNAATLLFDQGLADPRGGEYRSVEMVVGSVWGSQGSLTKRKGWVFPVTADGAPRFAVLWDGLVYPVAKLGGPADLEKDVALMVKRGAAGRGNAHRPRSLFPVADPGGEAEGLAAINPVGVGLLLRLGRVDLAEAAWAGLTNAAPAVKPAPRPGLDLQNYGFSYLTMTQDLAWDLFERAICALKRGDDAVVLHDARSLTKLRAAAEAKAGEMGFARPQNFGNDQSAAHPYIDFLKQLPELLADAERRAPEPKRPPIPPPGGPDRSSRIAALIRDLDQIQVNQSGQPGGVNLGEAATVQALIAEGDDAVEPLIEVLRRDHRLTRSVSFHRDFFRNRNLLTVDDAAYSALSGILRTSTFSGGSTSDNLSTQGQKTRDQVADQIRAYWDRYKAFPLVERWYQALANDQAGAQGWGEAAGNITRRENVTVVPSSSAFTSTVSTEPKPGEVPRLRGESLRVGHTPTVSDLMIRRAESLVRLGQENPAIAMAGTLQVWDQAASLPTLKDVSRLIRTRLAASKGGASWVEQNLVIALADFTVDRVRLGDPTAAEEYAALIRTTKPERFETRILETLEPFYRLPDNPTLRNAADHLFNDPGSSWSTLYQPGRKYSFTGHLSLLDSPMIRVPGFRRAIKGWLSDPTETGIAEVGPDQGISSQLKSGMQMGRSTQRVAPLAPAPGTKFPLRVADQVASELTRLEGCPDFQLIWPISKRDDAIAALPAFLDRFGSRFVPDKPPLDRSIDHNKTAYLVFPPLDHPATLAEAADGLAVFSLEPVGGPPVERRVVPLLQRPLAAQWTSRAAAPAASRRPVGHPPRLSDSKPVQQPSRRRSIQVRAVGAGLAGGGGPGSRPVEAVLRLCRVAPDRQGSRR